jgi:hypothetical protein
MLTRASPLAAAVVVALLLLGGAAAMHEDEQGKNDWFIRGVGVPTAAALHTDKVFKSLYVATQQGVVASLHVVSSSLRWRRVLGSNDTVACIAASDKVVVAATTKGDVIFMDPADGRTVSQYNTLPAVPVKCALVSPTLAAVAVESDAGVSVQLVTVLGDSKGDAKLVSAAKGEVTISPTEVAVVAGGKRVALALPELQAQKDGKAPAADAAHAVTTKDGVVSVGGVELAVRVRAAEQPTLLCVRSQRAGRVEVALATADGHLHFADIRDGNATAAWTVFGGLSSVAHSAFGSTKKGALADADDVAGRATKFGLRHEFFVLSTYGVLYAFCVGGRGKLEWHANAAAHVDAKFPKVAGKPFAVQALDVKAHSVTVRLLFAGAGTVSLAFSPVTGELKAHSAEWGAAVLRLPDGAHVVGGKVSQAAAQPRAYHVTSKAAGVIKGYTVAANSEAAEEAWQVSLGAPIVAMTEGSNPWTIASVMPLQRVPNATTDQKDVHRKYPMANVVVTCHFEAEGGSSTLVVTAIDAITGAVIGNMRHADVEGTVRVVVAEHMVVYHFLNVQRMAYFVGVWEMFEQQAAVLTEAQTTSPAQIAMSFLNKRRTLSQVTMRPPLVMPRLLLFPYGDVAAIGVTTSAQGISRKMFIFASAAGKVSSVPLAHLTAGGMPPAADPKNAPPADVVMIPPTHVLSYKHHVLRPAAVITAPTPLESTSHVLVVGLDIFYTRASVGKPFDMLDDAFNKQSLFFACAALPALVVVARLFAQRRTMALAWA